MNIIKTIAPIPIEDLKKYFLDNNTRYEIDYKNSTLKGSKLLIYLGNLNIPCDISTDADNEFIELLKDYFNSRTLVQVPILEQAALEVLLTSKLGPAESETTLTNVQISKFIEDNQDIIKQWTCILDSLTLFNMQMVEVDEFKDFVKGFPENDTDDLTGINFLNLLKHSVFYMFYQKLEKANLSNYTKYFNEYMFKGKNLYHYWADENNPLFLLTYGIASGEYTAEDYEKSHHPLAQ